MKLYFYNLDTYGSNPKGLCVKECEAEEKPKTYKAVDRVFPNYLSTAKKDDVGRITNFNCIKERIKQLQISSILVQNLGLKGLLRLA